MSDSDTNGTQGAAGRTPAGGATRKRLHSQVGRQRTEFLKTCRTRINRADLGLSPTKRKRTDGLRREEVAALSGVSASWYTWLEQGRDMRVSDEVLERVCQTLRLSEDERVYLFSLVQQRAPRVQRTLREEAPADIVRMLDAIAVPAIAMNLRWDVLAWNSLNSKIYRDYGTMPPEQRNLLEILLTRPVRHIKQANLESTAQRLVARLRFDYSRNADDPKFEALIHRLDTLSPLFRRLWRTPEFSLRAYGLHRFTHPRYGELAFEHTSTVPDGHPNIRLVICTPSNLAARRAVEQLNAALADEPA